MCYHFFVATKKKLKIAYTDSIRELIYLPGGSHSDMLSMSLSSFASHVQTEVDYQWFSLKSRFIYKLYYQIIDNDIRYSTISPQSNYSLGCMNVDRLVLRTGAWSLLS